MIKVTLSNEILKYITEIDKNRYKASEVSLPIAVASKLRKNSKKKSSYASTKIEGNPLSEKQVDEVIDSDERKHYLKPEQEVRNYFLALNYLEEKAAEGEKDVTIPLLRPDFETIYSDAYNSDIQEDPEYWINIAYASYYGFDSVSGIPREDWNEY